jgi:hypothetical protein
MIPVKNYLILYKEFTKSLNFRERKFPYRTFLSPESFGKLFQETQDRQTHFQLEPLAVNMS